MAREQLVRHTLSAESDGPDAIIRLVKSDRFNNFIVFVIIVASILVGVETYDDFATANSGLLSVLDALILIIFVVEIVLKIVAEGSKPWHFFLDPWNVFDFVIVVAALLPAGGEYMAVLRLTRILRVLRVSRLVTRLPRLQLIVAALLRSIPAMGYVSALLLLVFYIFAVVAVFVYGENDPVHFGTLQIAMVSLFRAVTMEDWTDLMYINMYGCANYGYDGMMDQCVASTASPVGGALFFIGFILVAGLIMINFFIGVVLTSMDEVTGEEEKRRFVQANRSSQKTVGDELATLSQHLDKLQNELELITIHYREELGNQSKADR
ncbi:MAG: ion transporter [Candidatus Promineifilaceae bacterium]